MTRKTIKKLSVLTIMLALTATLIMKGAFEKKVATIDPPDARPSIAYSIDGIDPPDA